MNEYWKNNELIPSTKIERSKLLEYEIRMFRDTCQEMLDLSNKTKFEINLLVESLATHSRVLIEFFYNDKNEKYSNDLVAQDFLNNDVDWKVERPVLTEFLKEVKNKADKQLAHLGLWRLKIKRDRKKGWKVGGVMKDIENVIGEFEKLKDKKNHEKS